MALDRELAERPTASPGIWATWVDATFHPKAMGELLAAGARYADP